MRETVRARVKQARLLEVLDDIELPEGAEVSVTIDFDSNTHALLKLAERSFDFFEDAGDDFSLGAPATSTRGVA